MQCTWRVHACVCHQWCIRIFIEMGQGGGVTAMRTSNHQFCHIGFFFFGRTSRWCDESALPRKLLSFGGNWTWKDSFRYYVYIASHLIESSSCFSCQNSTLLIECYLADLVPARDVVIWRISINTSRSPPPFFACEQRKNNNILHEKENSEMQFVGRKRKITKPCIHQQRILPHMKNGPEKEMKFVSMQFFRSSFIWPTFLLHIPDLHNAAQRSVSDFMLCNFYIVLRDSFEKLYFFVCPFLIATAKWNDEFHHDPQMLIILRATITLLEWCEPSQE